MICRVVWRTVSNFRRKMYDIYYGRKEIRPIGELKLIYISLKIPPLPVCPVKGGIYQNVFQIFYFVFSVTRRGGASKNVTSGFLCTNQPACHSFGKR